MHYTGTSTSRAVRQRLTAGYFKVLLNRFSNVGQCLFSVLWDRSRQTGSTR